MKQLLKGIAKRKLRNEVKKKFVKSKTDLASQFTPEKIAEVQQLIQPLIKAFWDVKNNSVFETNTQADIYLYDFESTWERGLGSFPSFDDLAGGNDIPENIPMLASPEKIKGATPRAVVKPKDVLDELERVPENINITDIGEKIAVLCTKIDLIKDNAWSKAETIGLITRLQNRSKYEAHRAFFGQFQNTNGEAIDKLLGKYKLDLKTADLFVPEFPDDAINIMKAYTDEVEKLCGKKPIFYVIAEVANFQKKYQRRDPILLAQSPFGIYYQILGAWDKEMILLTEL